MIEAVAELPVAANAEADAELPIAANVEAVQVIAVPVVAAVVAELEWAFLTSK